MAEKIENKILEMLEENIELSPCEILKELKSRKYNINENNLRTKLKMMVKEEKIKREWRDLYNNPERKSWGYYYSL